MFGNFIAFLFGPSSEIPPAASSHEEWDERAHNRRFNGVVGGAKLEAIKQVDLRSKARYDSMDGHIRRLRELKDKLHAKKVAKRAAKLAT